MGAQEVEHGLARDHLALPPEPRLEAEPAHLLGLHAGRALEDVEGLRWGLAPEQPRPGGADQRGVEARGGLGGRAGGEVLAPLLAGARGRLALGERPAGREGRADLPGLESDPDRVARRLVLGRALAAGILDAVVAHGLERARRLLGDRRPRERRPLGAVAVERFDEVAQRHALAPADARRRPGALATGGLAQALDDIGRHGRRVERVADREVDRRHRRGLGVGALEFPALDARRAQDLEEARLLAVAVEDRRGEPDILPGHEPVPALLADHHVPVAPVGHRVGAGVIEIALLVLPGLQERLVHARLLLGTQVVPEPREIHAPAHARHREREPAPEVAGLVEGLVVVGLVERVGGGDRRVLGEVEATRLGPGDPEAPPERLGVPVAAVDDPRPPLDAHHPRSGEPPLEVLGPGRVPRPQPPRRSLGLGRQGLVRDRRSPGGRNRRGGRGGGKRDRGREGQHGRLLAGLGTEHDRVRREGPPREGAVADPLPALARLESGDRDVRHVAGVSLAVRQALTQPLAQRCQRRALDRDVEDVLFGLGENRHLAQTHLDRPGLPHRLPHARHVLPQVQAVEERQVRDIGDPVGGQSRRRDRALRPAMHRVGEFHGKPHLGGRVGVGADGAGRRGLGGLGHLVAGGAQRLRPDGGPLDVAGDRLRQVPLGERRLAGEPRLPAEPADGGYAGATSAYSGSGLRSCGHPRRWRFHRLSGSSPSLFAWPSTPRSSPFEIGG